MINFLIWMGVFIAYFSIEYIINIFFTYKIKHISQGDYIRAAFAGSVSTFLFMFSTLIAAVLGVALIGSSNEGELFSSTFLDSKLLFIFWTTLALAIGNFCAVMSVPRLDKILKGRKKE